MIDNHAGIKDDGNGHSRQPSNGKKQKFEALIDRLHQRFEQAPEVLTEVMAKLKEALKRIINLFPSEQGPFKPLRPPPPIQL